ncbi:MAG TPA: formylmethanofuran dehydrogenase subunit C [Candidatus Bathyarchaeota archaeon]|nr:formylmethanofuran dehydrogenase subunit C [Candidatus Bathyarchaeota archaeon]
MIFQITPKYQFRVPVYAECISPDVFNGKKLDEIVKLKAWEGNKSRSLGDLFNIKIRRETELSADELIINLAGDFSKVRKIGANMTSGKIIVDGNIGMHLGENMEGGEIIVNGNADSWVGGSMKGGKIEIKGSAEDYIGAPYRGSVEGMKGGLIIIHGNAGRETGCLMRGGLIKIHGSVKHFVGVNMIDGTILVRGNSDGKAGAGMRNGKIIICGYIPSVLPTFTIDGVRSSTKVNGEKISGPFYRFIGDMADDGEGKLFISKAKNPHLKFYEKYLE